MKNLIFIIALILMLGIAGRADWAEKVIETIPCDLYQVIKNDIGGNPSNVRIAEYYMDNKDRYDAMRDSCSFD